MLTQKKTVKNWEWPKSLRLLQKSLGSSFFGKKLTTAFNYRRENNDGLKDERHTNTW